MPDTIEIPESVQEEFDPSEASVDELMKVTQSVLGTVGTVGRMTQAGMQQWEPPSEALDLGLKTPGAFFDKPPPEPSLIAPPQSLWQQFRTSGVGKGLLGPTDIERSGMAGGVSGSQLGVLEIPEAMMRMTAAPPPVAQFVREAVEPAADLLPSVPRGIAKGLTEFAVNFPLAPLPALGTRAGQAVLAAFGAEYLYSQPEQYRSFKKALDAGDTAKATEIATHDIATGGALGLGAAHARRLELAKRLTAAPKESVQAEASPVALDISRTSELSGSDFVAAMRERPGGLTGDAYRLGGDVATESDLGDLQKSAADAKAAVKQASEAGDLEAGVQAAMKAQYFREAYEYATGTGSAATRMANEPGYSPKFTEEGKLKSTLAAAAEHTAALESWNKDNPTSQVEFRDVAPTGQPWADQISTIDRKTGRIVLNAKQFNEWIKTVPEGNRNEALRSLLSEEQIHLSVDDAAAKSYWENLTGFEKAVERRRYTGQWRGRSELTDTLMGHEAVRFRMQQLARMTPREIAEASGREKWTVKTITALENAIRTVRETIGTKASKTQRAIIERMQDNLQAAKAAGAEGASAAEQGRERNLRITENPDGTFTVIDLSGERPVTVETGFDTHDEAQAFIDKQAPSALRKPSKDQPELFLPPMQGERKSAEMPARPEPDLGQYLSKTARPSFEDFRKQFPDMDTGDLREKFIQSIPDALEKASPEQLAKLRATLNLEKSLGKGEVGDANRQRVITEIADKLITEAHAEEQKAWERKSVTPDDVSSKPDSWRVISPEDESNPDRLGLVLTEGAAGHRGGRKRKAVGGQVVEYPTPRTPENVTKAVGVFLEPSTGKVHLLSAYTDKSGTRVVDPAKTTALRRSVPIANILQRLKPMYGLLLDEPVRNFHQEFKNADAFENEFAQEARQRSQVAEPPQPSAVESGKPTRVVQPETPGTLEAAVGMAEPEARALYEFVKPDASPEGMLDSLRSASESGTLTPRQRQVISALEKWYQDIRRRMPDLTPELSMAQLWKELYENIGNALDTETFVKRLAGKFEPEDTGTTGNAPAAIRKTASDAREAITAALNASIDWVKDAPRKSKVMLAQLAGKSTPNTSIASIESGNALIHYASAKIAAPTVARSMATDVLGDHHKDSSFGSKLGAVLVEDRLRAIRKGLLDAGNVSDSKKVETVIGKSWSPLASEKDFRAALNDPEIKAAIARHKASVQKTAELAHRESGGQLAGPGLHTGTFVNLKAILEGIEEPGPGGASRGNLENPLRRLTRFFRQAKGTAAKYEIDYRTLAERMVTGNFEESAKRNMYAQLVKDGLAIINNPGQPRPDLGKQAPVRFTIERKGVPTGEGTARTYVKNLWVRADIAGEVRQALNTDGAVGKAGLTAAANLINKIQLAGPTDAVWHTANMIGSIAGSQGGKTLLADLARKLPGVNLADAIGRVVKSGIRVLRDNPDVQRQLAELATMGALRGVHKAGPMGRMIQFIDKAGRLVRDDMYQNLVKRGLVDASEASRREWSNQMGQYNGRLMGQFQRFFKEAGFSPFIVAGRNFNRMAARRLLLDPGVKASSTKAAAEMKIVEAFGTIATLIAIPTFINYALTGSPSGRSGVKMGQIDTGNNDKDGNAIVIDPAQWTGLRRGLRISGVQAVIEGLRHSEGPRAITRTAVHDMLGGIMHPWTGPAVTAVSVAATGYDPRFYKESVNPKDVGENIKAALSQLNPVAAAIIKSREKDGSAVKQLGMSLGGAAGVKSVPIRNPIGQVADLHSAWMRTNDDPKIKADWERRQKEEFASDYKDLDNALRSGNAKVGLDAIAKLRETHTDKSIVQRMNPEKVDGSLKPLFHDSPKAERQFQDSLTPKQMELYEDARDQREANWKKFQELWAQR